MRKSQRFSPARPYFARMREYRFYVYMMASKSRVLYIGISNNLARRVWEHKQGLFSGFTKTYKIHRLVYYEVFHDVRNAIDREKHLKGLLRRKKVALIEPMNRTWEDLAEDWYLDDGKQVLRPRKERSASG